MASAPNTCLRSQDQGVLVDAQIQVERVPARWKLGITWWQQKGLCAQQSFQQLPFQPPLQFDLLEIIWITYLNNNGTSVKTKMLLLTAVCSINMSISSLNCVFDCVINFFRRIRATKGSKAYDWEIIAAVELRDRVSYIQRNLSLMMCILE